jgi:hypothetical protein
MSDDVDNSDIGELEGSLDQLVLIAGYSTQGKSASLRNIRNQEGWVYLNTESGKRLPFRNKFNRVTITDPYEVLSYFDECIENKDSVEGIILDSITFLMDMFETQYVLGSGDTMKGWSNYQQFFKQIMQQKVAAFGKPVIIIAHVKDELDEKNMEMKVSVPIKGALKNNGVEAYFTTVVAAKKIPIKELEKYGSKMLTITEEERELGYKHVFQTRITKGTTGERIRSPMGMFDRAETYIDNDAQLLLDHLKEFYGN